MSDNEIRFSVIVPTYDRPSQLCSLLDLLAQIDFPRLHYEVIVVDDGSTQPLDEVLRPYQSSMNLTLLRKSNAGPGSARNAGASIARGKFLAFTDDDCEPQPDWLLKLDEGFAGHDDCMIGGRTVNALIDNPYSATSQLIVDLVYCFYNRNPQDALFFASNNMAVPSEIFRQLGGFDPDFRIASEDRDLCDRWRHRGFKLAYAPEAVVDHAHPLDLVRFCKQHFRYGRGGKQYNIARLKRGSGRMRDDLVFHMNLVRSIREPLSKFHFAQSIHVFLLLVLWQCANAIGFFYESWFNRSKLSWS